MAKNTKIEWTDHTWNPWIGCYKLSPGCKECYMFRDQKRYGNDPREIRKSKTTFNAPLKWYEPDKDKVFICSWSDDFLVEADDWRPEAWEIIRQTPHLTYQILTKRPENIEERLPVDWGDGWPNVWLGVTVESVEYTSRIDILSDIPALTRFVSYEPALGTVSFKPWMINGQIDWLIAGGESGTNWRRPDPNWFRTVRHECIEFRVPFFFKQWGGTRRIDGAWGGNELDGRVWQEFPLKKS